MKKIIYITCLAIAALCISCEKKYDVWNSETANYAGRFVYGIYDVDGVTEYVAPNPNKFDLRIYNSAANVANEIWIDDSGSQFGLKAKCTISGAADLFKTEKEAFNTFFEVNTPMPAPTGAGIEQNDEDVSYFRFVIEEAKIIEQAAITPGGNKSDSIYMKIKLLSGTVNFVSKETNPEGWASAATPEYEWKVVESSFKPDETLTEEYIIKGYRYTGYPEDL